MSLLVTRMNEFVKGEVELVLNDDDDDDDDSTSFLPSSVMISEALKKKNNNVNAALKLLKEMKKQMSEIVEKEKDLLSSKSFIFNFVADE